MNYAFSIKDLTVSVGFAPFLIHFSTFSLSNTIVAGSVIGLEVYTEEGELLGILEDIFNTGSNDIYVVKNELGKQILLPSIPDVIKKIDMPNRKVIVHLLPGLV